MNSPDGLSGTQEARFQSVLDGARNFHQDLHGWHLSLAQELRDKMLVVAGVGMKTLFRFAYEPGFFGLWTKAAKVTHRVETDPHREGDGRVPVASASLPYVRIGFVRGEHGSLTNLPSVQQAVFRWLRGRNPKLPTAPRGALTEYLSGAADREASLAPHLDGSFRRGTASDDPGYLDFEPPDPRLMDEVQARIGQGLVPAFERLHLL